MFTFDGGTHSQGKFRWGWSVLVGWVFGWMCVAGVGCGGDISNDKLLDGRGGLRGVLHFSDGSIAVGAEVRVVNLPNLRAKTDAEGRFELLNIPAGQREIAFTHTRPFGARVPVWIVHGYTVSLEPSKAILTAVASISGRVSAAPRLDGKGIFVGIKGLPLATHTYDAKGSFRLDRVPAGCHILQPSARFFIHRGPLRKVCVQSGEARVLEEPLLLSPTASCEQASACATGALCVKGFCVPDPGGQVRLLSQGEMDLGAVPLEQVRTFGRAVLVNDGPGTIRITEARLLSLDRAFSLIPPSLPLRLSAGEQFSPTLTFHARTLGVQRAILELTVEGVQRRHYQLKFKATAVPYDTDCLQVNPRSLELGVLQVEQPRSFTLAISNRCGRSITLLKPPSSTAPGAPKELCQPEQFSTDACLTLVQQLPLKIPPGQTVSLEYQLLPQAYGELTGALQLAHDERAGARLSIPIHAKIPANGLSVLPAAMDFGLVPPDEARTLWLQLSFKKPISQAALQAIQSKVSASAATYIRPLSPRESRTPDGSQVVYLPLQVLLPSGGPQILKGRLRLSQLPGYKQPLVLPLYAQLAGPSTPLASASVRLGSTNGCALPAQPITLKNPSSQPITVHEVSWAAHIASDFQLEVVKLPLVIPGQSEVVVGRLEFTPKSAVLHAHAQLKLRWEQAGRMGTLVLPVQASAGVRLSDTFQQASARNADVLFYLDSSAGVLPQLNQTFSSLLGALKAAKISYRFLPLGGGTGISPLTPDPESELARLLQPTLDPSHQGLDAMLRLLQLRQTSTQRTTAVVFLSKQDDLSPYHVSRYLSAPQVDKNVAVFAAIPLGQCAAPTPRYQAAAARSGGDWFDICQTQPAAWSQWSRRLQRFVTGQRTDFLLSRMPRADSIQVFAGKQRLLRPEQWDYDMEQHQIIRLKRPETLPQGETLTVSYYSACR